MRFVECGDHGPVLHCDDEGVVVDHHDRGAGAFAGGEVDPVFQSFDGLRVFGHAAALHPFGGVLGELQAFGALQFFGEEGASLTIGGVSGISPGAVSQVK